MFTIYPAEFEKIYTAIMFAIYPAELENLHSHNILNISCRTRNFTLP